MKVKNLFFAVLASAAVLVGCEKKEDNLGPASLKVMPGELSFVQTGGDETFSLKATRDWTATLEGNNTEGVTVSPMAGKGSNDAVTVNVHMGKNDGANRTVKIRLTAGEMTETVTLTQPGAKGNEMTIPEVLAAAQDTEVKVTGFVAATNLNSFVMTDNNGNNLVVYFGKDATTIGGAKIGDEVKVEGKVGAYDKMSQIEDPTNTQVLSSGNTVKRGEAFNVTGETIESLDITKTTYLTVTGVYKKDGNYRNLEIVGTTIKGSLASPDAAMETKLTPMEGHSVTINGYFGGGAGQEKNNMFRNIIIYEITDNGEPEFDYNEVSASEFYAQDEAAKVSVSGTVMAVNQKGFMVGDASAVVYIYQNDMPSVKVGNTVTVKGSVNVYYDFKRIAPDKIDVTSDSEEVPVYGEGMALDKSNIETWEVNPVKYVGFKGILKGGRYITLDGTTRQAMLDYTLEDYSELNDTEVEVSGYSMGVNTKSNYLSVMAVKVEGQPYLKASNVSANSTETEAIISVNTNIKDWSFTKTDGDWITSADKVANTIKVIFPVNETSSDRTAKFTISANGVNNVEVTLTQYKKPGENEVTVAKSILEMSGTTNNGTQISSMTLDDVITLTASAGSNNGKVYGTGGEWRLYQTDKGTITVSAKDGRELVSVKITYKNSNNGALLKGDVIIDSDVVDVVSGSSIVYTIGQSTSNGKNNGRVDVTAVQVIYK